MLSIKNIIIGIFLTCTIAEGFTIFKLNDKLNQLQEDNDFLVQKLMQREEDTFTSNNIQSKALGEHILTFYTHTGNRTATGVYPKAGRTVAVDTNYIPHGTVLYIEGVGIRIAEDTGGKIKGNRLDVFVDTKEEAIKKGVRKAKVHVIKGVK